MKSEFNEFLKSTITLEIWSGSGVAFRSEKEGLKGLMEFIEVYGRNIKDIMVFDKIAGRGAVLLTAYIGGKEIDAKIGSIVAGDAAQSLGIKFYFQEMVPQILNDLGTDMCPTEKLSTLKSPEEFYLALKKEMKL